MAYKSYFVVRPFPVTWKVREVAFTGSHINDNVVHTTGFSTNKGMSALAAAECVTRWNGYKNGSRYYLTEENAVAYAAKMNGDNLKSMDKPTELPWSECKCGATLVTHKMLDGSLLTSCVACGTMAKNGLLMHKVLMHKAAMLIKPKASVVLKKGEYRKLPKSSSPMWTDQWAVQGSATTTPYIISRKTAGVSGVLWGCSCPAWTKNSPREDCKHILTVKLGEKIPIVKAPVQMLDDEHQKLFTAFLKQQAAAGNPALKSKPTKLFGEGGRKFR